MGIRIPIRKSQSRHTKTKTIDMKTFALALVAAASADDKKVPPRHPLQRLNKLNSFAAEWCNDNLKPSQATHWIAKFDRNTNRFKRRFEICPFYDVTLEHGGPAPAG